MGLHPVTYNLDVAAIVDKLQEDFTIDENGNRTKVAPSQEVADSRLQKAGKRNTGFIAQEVEELANTLGFDFSGIDKPENDDSFYGLRYAEFVVPLVKAMQEQQETINKLATKIEELENRLRK